MKTKIIRNAWVMNYCPKLLPKIIQTLRAFRRPQLDAWMLGCFEDWREDWKDWNDWGDREDWEDLEDW